MQEWWVNINKNDGSTCAGIYKLPATLTCDSDSIAEAVKYRRMFNIIDHHSGFIADFVVLKDEPFRQEEFNRRRKIRNLRYKKTTSII
jgi:hypothetical protein